ncbi:probable cytochrome P450 CYP44 [Liolophura sinensis]|uniref:probable cytochrome P450 CYP44 n=1 Tax=Liolophura sinensis TaxID=3198878 RepID=UPI00315900CD
MNGMQLCSLKIFYPQRTLLNCKYALGSEVLKTVCRSTCTEVGSISSFGKSKKEEDIDFRNAKAFSEMPGPKGLPYIGTLLEYRLGRFKIERYVDALLERHRMYGPIVKETLLGHTSVHLFHPELVKQYYRNEEKLPYVPPLVEATQLYRKKQKYSPGLGNMNGEEWYRLRSAVQQMMMRPKEVSAFFPHVACVADDFIRRISKIRDVKGEVPNTLNEFAKWSMESSGLVCFEKRFGCLDDEGNVEAQQAIDAVRTIFKVSSQLKFSLPLHEFVPTPKWKKLEAAEGFLYSYVLRNMEQTISAIDDLQKKGQLAEDKYMFMSYLLSRKGLSYDDVTILTLSLFSDPQSTTSPMLLFNMYCLAKNPEVQDKLSREIEQTFPGDEPVTVEKLGKMPYLKACVKETFRLFPTGPETSRLAPRDMVIGGYQIPAGVRIDLHNFVMCMSAEYFADPEKYLPERWIKNDSAQNIHPFIMIPFGHGPRMCIGRRFAEQELYVMLTKLVRKFHIQWHNSDMVVKYELLLSPKKPANFTFVDRK